MTRDIDKNPYTEDERRVCDYLIALAPDAGCGDDPIGFLIASHNALNQYWKRAGRPNLWEQAKVWIDDYDRREAAGEDVSAEVRPRLPGGSDW